MQSSCLLVLFAATARSGRNCTITSRSVKFSYWGGVKESTKPERFCWRFCSTCVYSVITCLLFLQCQHFLLFCFVPVFAFKHYHNIKQCFTIYLSIIYLRTMAKNTCLPLQREILDLRFIKNQQKNKMLKAIFRKIIQHIVWQFF